MSSHFLYPKPNLDSNSDETKSIKTNYSHNGITQSLSLPKRLDDL